MKRSTLRSTLIALTLVAIPAIGLPVIGAQSGANTAIAAQVSTLPQPAAVAGIWNLDTAHSRIGFAVKHLMIADVHGSFNDFEGQILVNEKDPAQSSVKFKARVASIDTNVAARDTHLKSPDFFDAEKFPEITFESTRIERDGDNLRALGTLTMHGVSKAIIIPFKLHGPVVDAFGTTRIGVEAKLELDRRDYGVSYNSVLDNGSLMIDNIVRISLDLEAVRPKAPDAK